MIIQDLKVTVMQIAAFIVFFLFFFYLSMFSKVIHIKKSHKCVTMNQIICSYKARRRCLILGQDINHIYYTSTIYGPGDAASKELWVNRDQTWKVCAFPSSSYRQTQV